MQNTDATPAISVTAMSCATVSTPHQAATGTLAYTAAETASQGGLYDYAADKLRRKDLDLVVANDVAAPGVGFGHDTNAVLILGADGSTVEVPLSSKRAVAGAILDAVAVRIASRTPTSAQKEQP